MLDFLRFAVIDWYEMDIVQVIYVSRTHNKQ